MKLKYGAEFWTDKINSVSGAIRESGLRYEEKGEQNTPAQNGQRHCTEL